MFYAIEYAYGRNIVNNGNRGDRVLEFSAKRLRDMWVEAGSPDMNSSGYREILTARDSRVRGVEGLENGEGEGWIIMARARINASVALWQHRYNLDMYDWCTYRHAKWVATAPEREILDWVEAIEADANEIEA